MITKETSVTTVHIPMPLAVLISRMVGSTSERVAASCLSDLSIMGDSEPISSLESNAIVDQIFTCINHVYRQRRDKYLIFEIKIDEKGCTRAEMVNKQDDGPAF